MKRAAIFVALIACASPAAPQHVDIPAQPTSSAVTPVVATLPQATTSCIVIDQANLTGEATTLEGTVECGEHSHPNGSTYTFCYVTLSPARCVKGMDEHHTVDEVQLAGEADFTKMKGQRIRVRGEPFPEHTAWHARPVLIMVKSFERL